MQSGLFIEVLVLQSERLMRIVVNPFILFQTAPGGVFAVPKEITVDVGHLSWDADLVAVEVVGLLAVFAFFIGPVMYLFQRFVGVGPSLFRAVFFEDFGFNQVVMQIVEVVLHFAVGIRLFSKANFFDQFIN